MRAVSAGSFDVTGLPLLIVTSAVAPAAAAIPSASFFTRACMSACTPSSNVRIVPTSRALSGMMLLRTPDWNWPTVTMAGSSVMLTLRLTMVCSAVTICAPITMGSTPCHGVAPWVWRPLIVISKLSEPAMKGPLR
jgi:hypothetical protein